MGRGLTRSAPVCSSTSATSVCPFSQAYVSAVSPVAVVAWTFAPEDKSTSVKLHTEGCVCAQDKEKLEEMIVFIAKSISINEVGRVWFERDRLSFLGEVVLTCSQQVFDQLQVSLLSSLHERRGAAQLDVGPGLDEEVSHLQEAPTAGERQGRLLGLLCLSVDVGTCRQHRQHRQRDKDSSDDLAWNKFLSSTNLFLLLDPRILFPDLF